LIADVMHEQNRNLDSPEIKLTQAKIGFTGPAAAPKQSRRQHYPRQARPEPGAQSGSGDCASARPDKKDRDPREPLAQIGNHNGNIREVFHPHTKVITHAAALVIRRRVHNNRNDPALDVFGPASDQEVIGAKLDLVFILPQPNEPTGAGKQERYGLRILR
jgi:hypothetical protein